MSSTGPSSRTHSFRTHSAGIVTVLRNQTTPSNSPRPVFSQRVGSFMAGHLLSSKEDEEQSSSWRPRSCHLVEVGRELTLMTGYWPNHDIRPPTARAVAPISWSVES